MGYGIAYGCVGCVTDRVGMKVKLVTGREGVRVK